MTPPKVTVITSSIGRELLERTIASVADQTYPATHYVFVNGPEFHDRAREILDHHPEVLACYLPAGAAVGDGPDGPEAVYAAAPYLVKGDILFYCNDDDYYEMNHVESVVDFMESNGLDWAYSLRKIIDNSGLIVAEDNCESLGHWSCAYKAGEHLVDCSSYAVRRSLAVEAARGWYATPVGDRLFLIFLRRACQAYGCTGESTVRYRIHEGSHTDLAFFEKYNQVMRERYPDRFPWRQRTVFRKGKVAEDDG